MEKLGDCGDKVIISDDFTFHLESFLIPVKYRNYIESILISNGMIIDRVDKLAHDILSCYEGKSIHFLCVLKGGSTFFQDLCNSIKNIYKYDQRSFEGFTFDFIKTKSYEGTESSGNVEISGCNLESLTGKHIIIVEDILDTGLTLSRIVTLLEKRGTRKCEIKAKFVGFSIPNKFVVGYGLDLCESYRDLNHIGVINQLGIDKFSCETSYR